MRHTKLLPLLASLLVAACSAPAADERAASTSQAATTNSLLDRFGFASPSPSSEEGAPGNEDVRGIGPWVLEGWTAEHASATDAVLASGKIPYVYLYVAAGTARANYGYQDCNVGVAPDKTLCHGGAAFLRSYADAVVAAYGATATAIAAKVGARAALVHVEPDYFQYTGTDQTAPLTYAESAALMNRIIGAIDAGCPTCKIVSDISPWCPNLQDFYSGWNLGRVAYGGLVGKYFPPTTGAIDSNTYAQMSAALGKPLVVSNAYGAGGAAAPYPQAWDDRGAVEAVAKAGVALVMEPNTDRAHYASVIAGFLSSPVLLANAGGSGGSGSTGGGSTSGGSASGGSTSGGSTSGGGGGTNAVWTFDRSPNINNYWVEAKVGAPSGASATKVEAIVDAQEWHTLSLEPWGNYADSFYVASGAHVVFRAWDVAGVAHDSNAFVWP
jgi:hypothetical protein